MSEDGPTKRLIILEGISGSGKSTMLAALNRATNFKDYHWHRFTATEWVYGAIENREVSLPELRRHEEGIQKLFKTTLVTMTCDPFVALERKKKMPNEIIEPNLLLANKLFLVYHNFLTTIQRKIIICTNDRSIDECVELALKRIQA